MHDADDETLMLAYRDGDASAFDVLYQRHRQRLFHFLVRKTGSRETGEELYQEAWLPYSTQQIQFPEAVERAGAPMRAFMLKQTRQSDFELFANLAKLPQGVTAETAPFRVIVPAFVTSELKTAFQIGFMIFIPFLVIDMVVASVLMSLGMMMLSPVLVALPFKLMLFVLADGWNILIGSLAASFAQ
mgnify:CR=1 FL=1